MKYHGLVELSVREFQGKWNGQTTWNHIKHAVGIQINGEIYDFKTLEKYHFISRNETGQINAHIKDMIIGNKYAIESTQQHFEKDKEYSEKDINDYIGNSPFYMEEYVAAEVECKKMIKKINKNK